MENIKIPTDGLHFCKGCNQYKPKTEFSKDKKIKIGIFSKCKLCYKKMSRERMLKLRDDPIRHEEFKRKERETRKKFKNKYPQREFLKQKIGNYQFIKK